MNGCIYRTKDNKCKRFSVGGVLSFCYLDGTCDCEIQSNGDRIRAMSDEGLAEYMADIVDVCPPESNMKCLDDLYAHGEGPYPSDEQCRKCWLDWLREEVEK